MRIHSVIFNALVLACVCIGAVSCSRESRDSDASATDPPRNYFGPSKGAQRSRSAKAEPAEKSPNSSRGLSAAAPAVSLSEKDREEIQRIIDAESAFLQDRSLQNLKAVYEIRHELLWQERLKTFQSLPEKPGGIQFREIIPTAAKGGRKQATVVIEEDLKLQERTAVCTDGTWEIASPLHGYFQRETVLDDLFDRAQPGSLNSLSVADFDGEVVSAYAAALKNGDRAVAVEVKGGLEYYGIIQLAVLFNTNSDQIVDVRSTKYADDTRSVAVIESFLFRQFRNRPASHVGLKFDDTDGQIDALSGATLVSGGFCSLVNKAVNVYQCIGGNG